MMKYDVLNTRLPRVDARAKATGDARYADDLSMSNMLYGAVLHSPLAHAKILNIDTSEAKKLPGVKDIITAKEAGSIKFGVSPARYDETMFCVDKVRYVGDEVAAVAAVDYETAQKALSMIKVDYEELPHYLSVFDAMEEGAVTIHDDHPNNISAEVHNEFGDVEKAFAECDIIKVGTFSNKKQDGAFLEPQACLAHYDLNGNLTLYSSTQSVHYVQRTVAMVLNIPVGKVRVVKPYVGGGFGPKAAANSMELIACLLSMRTGRPVKMCFSREEVFMHSRARHQFFHELKVGAKKDGTLMAVQNKCYLDGGAYSSFGIATVYYAGSLLAAPYKLPNMKYDGYRIYTNKPAAGAQRGHGSVVARACMEQLMDQIAEEIGMDPIELRLKNIMEKDDVTCNYFNMSSLGARECLEAVRDGSDWETKRGNLPKGKGIGMAAAFYVSGAGYSIYRSETYHATAMVKLSEDGGTVDLYTASAEIGQGSDTTFTMIVAETLGLRYEDVHVHSGDTDFGIDLGAYSSRQTLMTGHAVKRAAEDLKRQILDVLAAEFKIPSGDMDIKESCIVFKNEPPDFSDIRIKYIKEHRGWLDHPEGDRLTFREAARIVYLKKGVIVGGGAYKPDELGGQFKGASVGTSPAYSCSAVVAEVTVDEETGQVTVDKLTDAHDCGFAINRTNVEGQMQGSVYMGLGETLFEEVKFDEKGKLLNPTLGEYRIPTMLDMPNVNTIIVESNEPNGPYGAKEVGEGAILPTIPAIVNAVYDAVGVRINELPVTAERVFMALKGRNEKGEK